MATGLTQHLVHKHSAKSAASLLLLGLFPGCHLKGDPAKKIAYKVHLPGYHGDILSLRKVHIWNFHFAVYPLKTTRGKDNCKLFFKENTRGWAG